MVLARVEISDWAILENRLNNKCDTLRRPIPVRSAQSFENPDQQKGACVTADHCGRIDPIQLDCCKPQKSQKLATVQNSSILIVFYMIK